MSTLNNCLKGLAAVALIAASPIFLVFMVPFGYGIAGDLLSATGTAAALAVTTTICIAALALARYRGRLARAAMSESAAGSTG